MVSISIFRWCRSHQRRPSDNAAPNSRAFFDNCRKIPIDALIFRPVSNAGVRVLSRPAASQRLPLLRPFAGIAVWTLPDSKTMYSWLSSFARRAHLLAATQTLSGAAISEFDTSVLRLTRWSPAFFPGMGWKTT